MPFKEGEQVGPYRIMEQLGRGGMATVFKAYHASLDRYVAIKVLHPAFMEDPNFLARFQREARVVAKLEHPNIIPVYDFAEHEGRTFLVMKYIEGETLKARLQRQPLSPQEGVTAIQAVGEGLSYAHRQGVLHRDVKPSNVMLADDGNIYLADFGLARIASKGESTLSSDMMIGTPQYISPEQALGKQDLDEGTDIYSFGVLIYELVVGQVPFISDTPFSIIHDHIYSPLPLPRSMNPSVPEVIERLLLKSLAKERGDRFQSVDEMVAAFRQAIHGGDLPEQWVDPATYSPPETVQFSGKAAQIPAHETLVESGSQPRPKQTGWRRFWPVGLALGLCVCGFLTLSILSDDQQKPPLQNDPVAEAPQIDSPQDDPRQEDLERALAEAESRVEENPDDPFAHLTLAGALLDVGEEEAAREQFDIGAELAAEDPGYFNLAAEMLASRELWLPALEQYVHVLELDPRYGDRLFQEKFRQALYFASTDPAAGDLLFQNPTGDRRDAPVPFSLIQAAQARHVLFNRDAGEALGMVEKSIEANPEDPVARLVQAEVLLSLDRQAEARQILNKLLEGDQIPWIRVTARNLLRNTN